MTSKQRAYLKGLAMTMDPILQLGKEVLLLKILLLLRKLLQQES